MSTDDLVARAEQVLEGITPASVGPRVSDGLVRRAPLVDGLGQPAFDSPNHGVGFRESSGDLAVGLDGVECEAGSFGYFGDAEVSLHGREYTHQSACPKVLTIDTKGCTLKYMDGTTQARREWLYRNLQPLYSEPAIANMDDDELNDVYEHHHDGPYECPDCGDRHDGTTTGTERCPACEENGDGNGE